MRRTLDTVPIDGTIVIGEGERDEAPMLYIGETVGKGGVDVDIAVDPVEGTNLVANGLPNSIAVLVVHVLGAERDVMRTLRSAASERDREAEFRVEAEAPELLEMLDQADRDLEEYLGKVTATDLTEMKPRGDRPPKLGIEWVMSNYGHAREHLASIRATLGG